MISHPEKTTNMCRLVIFYKDSKHVYLEGLIFGNGVMVVSRDSDTPVYMQFYDGEGTTGLLKLFEYISPFSLEAVGLDYKLLDEQNQHYDLETDKAYGVDSM